jgi:signal transduction histidine kinase/DNA-binding response OmpR family regulator
MSTRSSIIGEPSLDPLFSGAGEMAALMSARDWSTTPLGLPAGWDRSLRTVVRIMLTSRYAMWMGWGPDLTFFYNDAYAPTLGAKHPWALGQPARQVWAEIWEAIGPRIDTVLQRGEATWDEGLLLFLERNGYPEETYHTFSYSPLPSDAGGVGGMLCVVTEETDRILGERRLALLRDLASRLAATNATEEVFAAVEHCLGRSSPDLPFSLTYLFEDDSRRARLVSRTEISADHPAAAAVVEMNVPSRWPFADVIAQSTVPVVVELDAAAAWPRGNWPRSPDRALLVPIPAQGQTRPAGVFIAGLNVHRPLDDAYRAFIRLFVGQLTAGLANARAYEAERRRSEALAEIDRAKTTFFSNVSHEFRTPLTLMLGPIEDALAERERFSPEDVERWDLLHRNGQRLSKLVNTLLDFARIEAGRLEATYEATDLPALTRDLASAFRSAIERAGLRLTVDAPPLGAAAYLDRDMWEKIVLNLLSNALKFTFDGAISVSLRSKGDHVELTVADTGVGVAPEELPHLFDRFYRVRGTESRTHEGTGIGLALVQELVRLHGGTVAASSVLGRGTTFTVTIPNGGAELSGRQISTGTALVSTALGTRPFVEEALRWLPAEEGNQLTGEGVAAPRAGNAPLKGAEPGRDTPRILLADDNADVRQYVSRILGEKWDVEAVADGEAALRAVQIRRPDLILSDVMMPKLDGFGLVRALREDPATTDLPIILLSARAGEDATAEGLGQGANDYLVKPFSSRELVARVAAQLERAHAQQIIKKNAEAERRRLHSFLMEAPAAIAILRGPKLVFELANDRCFEIFGKRAVIGQPGREALPELVEQGVWDLLDRVFTTGNPFSANEFRARFQRDDGGPVDDKFFNWVAQPTHDEQGQIDGVMVFAVEVTEQAAARRQVEQARATERQLRRAAEEGSRAKDEFLAMLGHELRNPLAPIVTALHLMRLRGSDRTEKQRGIIERQVKHLTRLVDDLLDVSRIARGKVELHRRAIELSEAVARAIEVASPIVEQREHHLELDLPQRGLTVHADPVRLAQVVTNLLTNAAKYTDPKGTIAVTGTCEGEQVVLKVRDTGIGITPAMLPRVFDLFAQEWQASDRSHGGLGLGLSIVRSLVNLHGGTVEAHSLGLGHGSEFVVRLPAAAVEDTADERAGAPQEARSPRNGRKILVVDDNLDVTETFADLLEDAGYIVRTAPDGPAALQLLDSFVPDLALLDIGLPVMDGYELAGRIRERSIFQNMSLVAVSGYGQEADREKARQSGFVAHLVKPVDPDRLIAVVEELTGPVGADTQTA